MNDYRPTSWWPFIILFSIFLGAILFNIAYVIMSFAALFKFVFE